jgi:excisionase family DNA binding protein
MTAMHLLTVADAARLLGVVPATVRQMNRDGRLPAIRTEGGIRLFQRDDVLQLQAERQARTEETRSQSSTTSLESDR